jgi:hypothetical protein
MDVLEKLCFIILPLLITSFLYSMVSRKLKERDKFIEKSIRFISAFNNELRFIDYTNNMDRAGKDIPDILRTAYDGHESAYLIFRKNLGWINKIRIEKAWKKYTGDDKYLGKPTFRQHATD